MNVLTELAYQVSKRLIKRTTNNSPHAGAPYSTDAYRKWRMAVLREITGAFDLELIRNKDVLDFGSGTGELSFLLGSVGARSVIGIELSTDGLDKARRDLKDEPIQFIQALNPTEIPLSDGQVDVIVCFDVMESFSPSLLARSSSRNTRLAEPRPV